MSENLTNLLYLVTIVTFILALRFLSSPRRAREGNLLGAILVIGPADGFLNDLLLVIAIAFGTINVVGGFLVTDRMLGMFKGKKE